MNLKPFILILLFSFISGFIFAQNDSLTTQLFQKSDTLQISKKKIKLSPIYNPLAPSKAAFYSAIFPGMGQIYNKKYWKAPIVWGALALPVYYYQINNNDYKRYRNAYRLRKNGLVDEFTVGGIELVSMQTLETAQKQLRENRDMSLLTGVILYILQIVEASVNAHLMQFNTDDNLTIKPQLIFDPIRIETPSIGLTFKYNF
ncbi:DUF5683 domain-containing protein [Polaribacter sp.]|uniref:DUF5683 domain-containing protein n=1 Tax=Polaribacter sp. TaxID=1920175 RepID=UPI000714BAF8|nr:MAG: hypothetical protein ABS28_02025 [Cryomorphaceae bacterium BACL22 MAG-120619-bin32]